MSPQEGSSFVTDFDRWKLDANFDSSWTSRTTFAAALCADSKAVCDIGCGMQALRRLLPTGVSYFPADLVARTSDTEVCELNAGQYPIRSLEKADTCTLLGVIEYLTDVPALFATIFQYCRRIIVSYNPTDFAEQDRTGFGWVNSFHSGQVIQLLSAAGYVVREAVRVDQGQILYMATRADAPIAQDDSQPGRLRRAIPYTLSPEDQLCFLHIPKAAGSTLIEAVSTRFDQNRWRHRTVAMQFTPEELDSMDFLAAHGDHRDYLTPRSRKPVLMTMFRDPVARAISFYRFLSTRPESHDYKATMAYEFNDLVFVEGMATYSISNYVTRMFSDCEHDPGKKPDLALAIDRLHSDYTFIGICEFFGQSLDLLAYTFGWPAFGAAGQANVTEAGAREVNLSEAALERLRQINDLDLKLYEEALMLFRYRHDLMLRDKGLGPTVGT